MKLEKLAKPFPMSSDAETFLNEYANSLSGVTPSYFFKSRPDGDFLVLEFAAPTSRFYENLTRIESALPEENIFKGRVSISARQKKPANVLLIPEVTLLQAELAANLTVDRDTFGDEFLARYTASVTGLETRIVVNANSIVFGRRGSGKSSLLAYARHQLRLKAVPFCWVAMQTYAGRGDIQAIASTLGEIFSEAALYASAFDATDQFRKTSEELSQLGEETSKTAVRTKLSRMVPRLRKLLALVAKPGHPLTIFLDDVHVVDRVLQPELLAYMYSLSRGNNVYLKLSGIEQLTNLWDGEHSRGLEPPHDITLLHLDHNLTDPALSKSHIESILDKHAKYCGLPSIGYLAGDEYFDRLVLAAAAVPRDAISLFLQSLARSIAKVQKQLSVMSLNAAASSAIEEKLKDVEKDVEKGEGTGIAKSLERVKRFCLSEHKKNAFLVRIANGTTGYNNIQRLVALRFVHVLHEGITPHKAGERYVALMLDFGFYIGIRAAKSIELFPDRPRPLAAKELRKLPILDPAQVP
jgi:hypothetical protein